MTRSCISIARDGTVILAIALFCSACSTAWTPFQGSLWNPAQIFTESTEVRGLRTNFLYGKNANLYGIDVGFVNNVDEYTAGIQSGLVSLTGELDGIHFGFVNSVEEHANGIQAGAVNFAGRLDGIDFAAWNHVEQRVRGVQLGGANFTGELDGLSVALANQAEERVRGAQLAFVANLAGEIVGAQVAGIHNQAESVVGVQIGGIVNHAGELHGLQIGFLNFNSSGPLPFFPLFNFAFPDKSEEGEEDTASK